MKKKFTLVLSMLMMAGLVYDYQNNSAHTSSGGAPAGNTGSPGDGMNCSTSCHVNGPTQTDETVEITSDIPGSGYVAGTTYSITVTMTKAGVTKFGFQLSPQDLSGNGLGTLIVGSGSDIIGTDYITHGPGSVGTSGSGSKTWTFGWTAPASGTGDVTFYVAGNFTNASGGTDGDVIVTESVTVSEASVGISEAQLEALAVYPNPVVDDIHVAAKDVDEEIMFTVYNMNGQKVLEEKHEAGKTVKINVAKKSLSSGVYFLQMEVDGNSTIKKLMVK